MALREEFVDLAQQAGANVRLLCRRFGISPTMACKWLARARAGEALTDRSHRPATSPGRCAPEREAQVMALCAQHPAWGHASWRVDWRIRAYRCRPSARCMGSWSGLCRLGIQPGTGPSPTRAHQNPAPSMPPPLPREEGWGEGRPPPQ
ncbi:helix-turn-helix domain-containing protein [Pseudomonas oryzihabitans]|uniref:helix-turn-helix domain-containing protein n=1 Tax=Pseudomonas oryzihabitans TaxID=47885 RepID=UPI003460F899